MNEVIQTFAAEHLYRFAFIVSLCMAAMLVAMVVDLIFGVRKAKRNGEATTSTGLKKTCDKARKYFSPFMATVCIDIIAACANFKSRFSRCCGQHIVSSASLSRYVRRLGRKQRYASRSAR